MFAAQQYVIDNPERPQSQSAAFGFCAENVTNGSSGCVDSQALR